MQCPPRAKRPWPVRPTRRGARCSTGSTGRSRRFRRVTRSEITYSVVAISRRPASAARPGELSREQSEPRVAHQFLELGDALLQRWFPPVGREPVGDPGGGGGGEQLV